MIIRTNSSLHRNFNHCQNRIRHDESRITFESNNISYSASYESNWQNLLHIEENQLANIVRHITDIQNISLFSFHILHVIEKTNQNNSAHLVIYDSAGDIVRPSNQRIVLHLTRTPLEISSSEQFNPRQMANFDSRISDDGSGFNFELDATTINQLDDGDYVAQIRYTCPEFQVEIDRVIQIGGPTTMYHDITEYQNSMIRSFFK